MDRIRALLECVPIDRVISVDDRYAPDINVVINLARGLSGGERAELLGLPDDADTLDEQEFFEQRLEALWPEYQKEQRTEIVQRVQEMAGQSLVADDTQALRELEKLMPENTFEALALAGWNERRDAVLQGEESVLVLFDRDFSAEGGREDEGERLLAELQQASQEKPIWAGLLTHTVTPEQEHETYLSLGEVLDLHRTIVISKARIKEGKFPAYLRLTLLAPLMRKLVTIVAEQVKQTQQEAIDEALGVLPVELESMVFGASQVEGIWEPDTLLLLFGLVQRDKARAKVWEEDEVHELTRKVRCLARVEVGGPVAEPDTDGEESTGKEPEEPEHEPVGQVPRFYQRRQIYEDIDVVNKLHLPIECGDIFEDSGRPSKKWIVVAQPCELMVRATGRRGDYPITHVVLAPIERERKNSKQEADFRLSYFDDQGRHYLAKLAQARYQRIWLLDFAVFSTEGRAVLALGDEPPPNMHEGWGARHARLLGAIGDLLQVCAGDAEGLEKALGLEGPPEKAEVEALAASVRHAIATDHARPPFTTTINIDARSVDAGCRRIGRLSADYARALLSRWGTHLSRPVLPYDLTRRPDTR